jgi:23S rRNA pseudouridine1911/1915/1917 synthase
MTEEFDYEFDDEYSHEERRTKKERPKFTVLYEDERIIAFDKGSGISSIPERYIKGISLKEIAEEKHGRLWTVHRIDKDTSGVIVYARDSEAHKSLNDQFEQRRTKKTYAAFLEGELAGDEVPVDIPLVQDTQRPGMMRPSARGKESVTIFRVRELFDGFTYAEAEPVTGRMHQIRVHAKAIGLPLIVDPLYGNRTEFKLSSIKRKFKDYGREEKPLIERLTLHAERLTITHPGTGEPLTFEAPMPKEFRALLTQLRKVAGKKGMGG